MFWVVDYVVILVLILILKVLMFKIGFFFLIVCDFGAFLYGRRLGRNCEEYLYIRLVGGRLFGGGIFGSRFGCWVEFFFIIIDVRCWW